VPRERLVEEPVKHYHVVYERDESGWWVASVRGVHGCHTQGRTVDEARRRIREALELFVDDAPRVPIVDDVKLPGAATRAIRAYATLRKKADEEDRRAALAARRAVRILRTGTLKMSARDAARLLGLSHQRVHQLTQKEGTR
jgi:predicted RNase H-like HicB family nuclease